MPSQLLNIGKVSETLNISAHTLRYYEKIRLLNNIAKTPAGHRLYNVHDIARIKFIKRAQRMQFSLEEIKQLASLDMSCEKTKPHARTLVKSKLQVIDENLEELHKLKISLTNMLQACEDSQSSESCPIILGMKDELL